MIATRDDAKSIKWTTIPSQLTLEKALEILNPDSRYNIADRRGAYKRILEELSKDKSE